MKKLLFLLLITLPALHIYAQETCEAITQEAVTRLADLCASVGYDQLCFDGTAIDLSGVGAIQTPPYDGKTYGAALMNTSANFPRSIGDRGVLFVLLGDTRVVNAVPLDQVYIPVEPVTVTTLTAVNLRSRPSADDVVLASVNREVQLPADGISPDTQWLRVSYQGTPAWVFRSLVQGEGIGELPTIRPGTHSMMQQFSLTNGLTASTDGERCAQAPDILVIQGLPTQPAQITVNGAEMFILSTVVLQSESRSLSGFASDAAWRESFGGMLPADVPADATCHFTRLSAVDGGAFLNDYQFSIPRGYRAYSLNCSDEGEATWDRAEPMTGAQLAELRLLEDLAPGLLRYRINLPTVQEINETRAQIASAVGETRPTTTNPESTSSQSPAPASRECPGFRPTHPLTGIGFGYVRFYWDPAPGATSYRVNLINVRDELVGSFATQGPETNVRVDTTSPALIDAPGSRMPFFSYEIIAYQDGQVICSTPPLTIQRDFDPDPDCPEYLWFSGTCEDVIHDEP